MLPFQTPTRGCDLKSHRWRPRRPTDRVNVRRVGQVNSLLQSQQGDIIACGRAPSSGKARMFDFPGNNQELWSFFQPQSLVFHTNLLICMTKPTSLFFLSTFPRCAQISWAFSLHFKRYFQFMSQYMSHCASVKIKLEQQTA